MEKQSLEINQIQAKVISLLCDDSLKPTDIFQNTNTLRLKRKGARAMQRKFESWELEPPVMTAGNMINFIRKMTFPYYIDKKRLVLFTEVDAMFAKLAGAQGWLDGK